ncbi:MAG: QueT transporter family protein [Candidatus Bathyarchaeota archaeon]|nr:QueT transporter family protein [Candidatus Bathyarchaeota archaeon]
MKIDSRKISLTAFFAAAYAVSVILFAFISFDPRFQIRVADALLPLSIIFGPPAAVGLGLGCSIANFYGGYGIFGAAVIVDVVGGGAANFIACILAWFIGGGSVRRRFLGCLIENATVTIIVGSYLSLIYGIPIELSMLGLFIGSLVSINILGFMLLETLYRMGIGEKYVRK